MHAWPHVDFMGVLRIRACVLGDSYPPSYPPALQGFPVCVSHLIGSYLGDMVERKLEKTPGIVTKMLSCL